MTTSSRVGDSGFVLFRHSAFVLRHSVNCSKLSRRSTVAFCARCEQPRHTTIVSPRAGPTLIIDNFAPVSSEMHLTYLLAADGSCENFRAA
jgi:hypothetical protein